MDEHGRDSGLSLAALNSAVILGSQNLRPFAVDPRLKVATGELLELNEDVQPRQIANYGFNLHVQSDVSLRNHYDARLNQYLYVNHEVGEARVLFVLHQDHPLVHVFAHDHEHHDGREERVQVWSLANEGFVILFGQPRCRCNILAVSGRFGIGKCTLAGPGSRAGSSLKGGCSTPRSKRGRRCLERSRSR